MFLRVTAIAAAAIATAAIGAASPANAEPLQPGPHSFLADVDLPQGAVQCADTACVDVPNDPVPNPTDEESWSFSAPYDDVVAFLQTRFATGRRYDTHGATWWNGLPPCYDTNHRSPPWGWTTNDYTWWQWADSAKLLIVLLDKPVRLGNGDIRPFGTILIISHTVTPGVGMTCYRA
jgi:hypothetical protein